MRKRKELGFIGDYFALILTLVAQQADLCLSPFRQLLYAPPTLFYDSGSNLPHPPNESTSFSTILSLDEHESVRRDHGSCRYV